MTLWWCPAPAPGEVVPDYPPVDLTDTPSKSLPVLSDVVFEMEPDVETATERIDRTLIAQGCPEECVTYVCAGHRRHCNRIGTEHDQHVCWWCENGYPDLY